MYKTYNCGDLRKENIGEIITLSGWVHSIRKLGSVSFLDLRDLYGLTQISFYEDPIFLNKEFVICTIGEVTERLSKNFSLFTGDIEILVKYLRILNSSYILPFSIEKKIDRNDELHLKYRYLDLRKNILKNKLIFRHKINFIIREYLFKRNFLEIETPILIKSTYEGSRNFIVPSRKNPGFFYALPQSPQYIKQLIMIGGLDKYFQFVKCFRDEDYRNDRQLEFTQIDCEMSFIRYGDIIRFFESMIIYTFKIMRGIQLKKFYKISYKEAIYFFGSDKPDLRLEMKFKNFIYKQNIFFWDKEFIIGIKTKFFNKVFLSMKSYQQKINRIRCLKHGKFQSSLKCDNNDFKYLFFFLNAKEDDLIFIIYGEMEKTQKQLGEFRLEIGKKLGFCSTEEFLALWVINFPLYKKYNNERYDTLHHPFTNSQNFLFKNPEKILGQAYDLIINGIEIGGGSIRINKNELQIESFRIMGFSRENTYKEFGFLINSFNYGAPPHGGVAFGLDRLIALLFGKEIIRDFIAFPKNNVGKDLLLESPSNLELFV